MSKFCQNTPNTSKWPWHIKHTPLLRPKFSSVFLYDEPFLSDDIFSLKYIELSQMILTCSTSKLTIYPTYIPKDRTFNHLALQWTVLDLRTNFVKSVQNNSKMTLTYSRSNVPICIQHAPQRPIFSSLSLCDEPLLSWGYWEKFTESTQNYLDMFMAKGTHMHSKNIPEAQLFVRNCDFWFLY